MGSLSPRERVATALTHKDPGKVPIDLGEGRQTSTYRELYLKALAVLRIGESEIITSPRGVIDQFDERFLKSLDIDLRWVSLRDVPEGQVFEPGDILRDEWYARFNRKPNRIDIGFGQSSDDVAAFKSPGVEILLSYHQVVLERSSRYIRSLSTADRPRAKRTVVPTAAYRRGAARSLSKISSSNQLTSSTQ